MFIGFVQCLKSVPSVPSAIGAIAEKLGTRGKPAVVALVATALTGGLIWTDPQSLSTPSSVSDAMVSGAALDAAVSVIVAKAPVIRDAARAGASPAKPAGVDVVSVSAQKLFTDFRKIGYRLEDLRKGVGDVPRVFVKSMPNDMGLVRSIPRRKAVFIKTMLPLILSINEELRATRTRVQDLAASTSGGAELNAGDRAWLAAQYDRFGVKPGALEVLLRRIDVIPPSLAMAQGAEESGWGSSRFAREGRALFGQRTFKDRPGIVPHKRSEGDTYKVRTFNHLLDGVRSYVHNLNTHPAYAEFRALRARLRADAGGMHGIDSLRLVETLRNYSERGENYIKTIKSIIRFNDLKELDDDRLEEARNAAGDAPDPA